ncbi:unnamed protein product [Calicophoron daubneyi]|uniref:Negative elongation factor A n=1 Tax=Calicophoron daubneyi TaxID=300641 RepID=A0AAV2T9L6_CALDB
MSDLQKFIRQQFFDNNWTRDVDLSNFTTEKIAAIDSSFSHLDVKSKLCLLLSFSSSKPSGIPEIDKHVESIFLQALDEENNLVKAVATILHSKQSLNYLNFDISPTNEAFKKNIEKLLRSSDDWGVVRTPLLAEYLGENVLKDLANNGKRAVKPKDITPIRSLGFKRRGKSEALSFKESYLDKLKDECQRKRIHVPIPGRSFARLDEPDGGSDGDGGGGFIGNSSASVPRNSTAKRYPSTWNRSLDGEYQKPSTPWPRAGQQKPEKLTNSRPLPLNERLAIRSSAAANCRKPSGIKLLDFDELPAFGPKAKQLRKEQMEKEREIKRQEREERVKEQRAAREAAKLARQAERQALSDARRQSTTNLWPAGQTVGVITAPVASSENRSTVQSTGFNSGLSQQSSVLFTGPNERSNRGDDARARIGQYPNHLPCVTSTTTPQFGSQAIHGTNSFMIQHPLLSVSDSLIASSGVTDEDDDEDEDDDMAVRDSQTGMYKLGIASNFRGFNPAARVSLQSSCATQNASPMITSSTNSLATLSVHGVPTIGTRLNTFSSYQTPNPDPSFKASMTLVTSSLNVLSNPTPITVSSSLSYNTQLRVIAPRPPQPMPTPSASISGTIRVIGGPQSSPLIRIFRPQTMPLGQLSTPQLDSATLSSSLPLKSSTQSVGEGSAPMVALTNVTGGEVLCSPAGSGNGTQEPLRNLGPTLVRAGTQPILQPHLPGTSPVRIAPRSTRFVRLVHSNSVMELAPGRLQPSPNVPPTLSAAQSPPFIIQQPQPQQISSARTELRSPPVVVAGSTTTAGPHPTNTAWTLDGRPDPHPAEMLGIRLPFGVRGNVDRQKINHSPPNAGYIQILPRPVVPVSLPVTSPQHVLHATDSQAINDRNLEGVIPGRRQLVMCDAGSVNNSERESSVSVQISLAGGGSMPVQFPSQPVLPTNSSAIPSVESGVKIQDDLCLTEAQVNSVHNLFQGANRVSRPEKAMIVSFIAGARGNPRPETGNTLRIRLSEYRERVINQATGQVMDVAADTYLHMDYATGKCEKVKCYRNEPPEVLLRLPVQQATQ